MIFRLVLLSSVISGVVLASDNTSTLSPFRDASKSLQQLARESVDREIAASVKGRRTKDLAAPLTLRNLPVARLQQRTQPETCSIPLLESKIQHPERFRMQVLKVPARRMDNIATPAPAPACEGWN